MDGGRTATLCSGGEAIEEIDHTGLQRILRTNDQQAFLLNHPLQDGRSMSQVAGRDPDVCQDRLAGQGFVIMPEVSREQSLDRWPDSINDRAQVPRLSQVRLLQLFQGRLDRATPGMPQDNNQAGAEPLRRKLHTADLRGGHDVAGYPDDEEVTQSLIENNFDRHAGVRASQDDGERLLAGHEITQPCLTSQRVAAPDAGYEAAVALSEPLESFERSNYGHVIEMISRSPLRVPSGLRRCLPI
jgi:hypothetical protein